MADEPARKALRRRAAALAQRLDALTEWPVRVTPVPCPDNFGDVGVRVFVDDLERLLMLAEHAVESVREGDVVESATYGDEPTT